MRYSTAFDIDANDLTYNDATIEETKQKNEDFAGCAQKCDMRPACRAIFYWHDTADWRCKLLKRARQLMVTSTVSYSATKQETAAYYLAAEGNNQYNSGEKLRFANVFDESSHEFSTMVQSKSQCFAMCNNIATCQGVAYFFDTTGYRCTGLRNIPKDFIQTDMDILSYAKRNYIQVNNLVPSGFTLDQLGKTMFESGRRFRYSTAFDPAAKSFRTELDTIAECVERCRHHLDCAGVFFFKLGNKSICRGLKSLGGYVKSNLVGVSISRNDPPSYDDMTIPALAAGPSKYKDAVLADNGKIYMIPRSADAVLILDPETDTIDVTTMAGLTTTTNKWVGGVKDRMSGKIFGMPYASEVVLVIDPSTNTYDITSMTGLGSGPIKWTAAAQVDNGMIVASPFGASTVLYIDPSTMTYDITSTDITTISSGTNKWLGAIAIGNKVYCIPFKAGAVLVIDAETKTATSFGSLGEGVDQKWNGGARASNGLIYGMPLNSQSVLIIDPTTMTTDTTTISGFPAGGIKWRGAALSKDGETIYAAPGGATSALAIYTESNTYDMTTITGITGNSKFLGAIFNSDKIYFVPFESNKVGILRLDA